MPARQTRRPRRRTTVPASSLPRPGVEDVMEGESGATEQPEVVHEARARRHHAAPRHHVREDYSYVRTDLIGVAVVGAVTLAFVVGASFLF